MTAMTPARPLLRRLPLIVVAVAAVLGAVVLRDVLTFEALRDNRLWLIGQRDAHFGLAVAGFMVAYVAIVALSLPGATVATLTGGFLFGLFPGAAFNVIAASLGACLIFLAARAGLGDRLSARMAASEGAIARLKAGIDANQWSVLLLMRLVPAVPFFLANLLPALWGVRLWPFAATTFLGIIPGAVVYTSVGAGLGAVFERGEVPDLGILFTPPVLLPILGLCALAALPVILRLARRGR